MYCLATNCGENELGKHATLLCLDTGKRREVWALLITCRTYQRAAGCAIAAKKKAPRSNTLDMEPGHGSAIFLRSVGSLTGQTPF